MDAADDAVGLEHEIAPRRRRNRCGIVGEPERARMRRDRPEVSGDQMIFGGGFVGRRLFAVLVRHEMLAAVGTDYVIT